LSGNKFVIILAFAFYFQINCCNALVPNKYFGKKPGLVYEKPEFILGDWPCRNTGRGTTGKDYRNQNSRISDRF